MTNRPVLRWHGGKWVLAPWIISHFPRHRVYVEPFGGAASVLLRKARSYAEVYNDLDHEIVTLFRVLRSPRAPELLRALTLTPFAREEFEDAYASACDDVEISRRMIIRSFMGFGSTGALGRNTGFRADSNRSGTTPAHDWANYPEALTLAVKRLAGVVIENSPALDVMARFDGTDTLHYVDPPYVFGTRGRSASDVVKQTYRHEMTDAQHAEMLAALRRLSGFVVVSGYSTGFYADALCDWTRIDRDARADGARLRIESLWLNPRCVEALVCGGGVQTTGLFDQDVGNPEQAA